jgi:hypothetical protein
MTTDAARKVLDTATVLPEKVTMRNNQHSFARLVGGAVKLAQPEMTVSTYSDFGHVTLLNGQVFRFAVEEVTPEQAAAVMSALPGGEAGSDG